VWESNLQVSCEILGNESKKYERKPVGSRRESAREKMVTLKKHDVARHKMCIEAVEV